MKTKVIYVCALLTLLAFNSCAFEKAEAKKSSKSSSILSSSYESEHPNVQNVKQEVSEYLFEDRAGTLHLTKACRAMNFGAGDDGLDGNIFGASVKYLPVKSANPNAYYCTGCITTETYKKICVLSAPEWDGE